MTVLDFGMIGAGALWGVLMVLLIVHFVFELHGEFLDLRRRVSAHPSAQPGATPAQRDCADRPEALAKPEALP